MDYMRILQHSWDIIKKRRWLWWLGILVALTESGGSSFGQLPQFISNSSNLDKSNPVPSASAQEAGEMALSGVDTWARQFLPTAFRYLTEHWGLIVLGLLVGLVVALVVIYISYSARAGLILSVVEIEDKKKELGFVAAFKLGRKYSWRLLGFTVTLSLMGLGAMVLFICLVGVPFFFVFSGGNGNLPALIAAGLLSFACLLVVFIFSLYLHVVRSFGERAMLLDGKFVIADIFARVNLMLKHQLGNIFISHLVTIAVQVVYGIALIIALLIIGGALGLIGFLIYATVGVVAVAGYGLLMGLLLIIALFIVKGIYTAFTTTYWTIIYRAISYLTDHHGHHKAA